MSRDGYTFFFLALKY